MMKSLLGLFLIFGTSLAARAEEPLCSQPMDRDFPQVLLIAPDFSLISSPQAKLEYSYQVKVIKADGSVEQVSIQPSVRPRVAVGLLGQTSLEGEFPYVNVETQVTLKALYPGNYAPEVFTTQLEKKRVTTAALCLPAPELHWQEIEFAVPSTLGLEKLLIVKYDFTRNGSSFTVSEHNPDFKASQKLNLRLPYFDQKIQTLGLRVFYQKTSGGAAMGPRIEHSLNAISDHVNLTGSDFSSQ